MSCEEASKRLAEALNAYRPSPDKPSLRIEIRSLDESCGF